MLAANPTSISKSVPVSDLCVLCVSVFSSPNLSPFHFQLLALSVVEGSTFNCFPPNLSSFNFKRSTFNRFLRNLSSFNFKLSTFNRISRKSFTIRTYGKSALNLFRMNTYKTNELKNFIINN